MDFEKNNNQLYILFIIIKFHKYSPLIRDNILYKKSIKKDIIICLLISYI